MLFEDFPRLIGRTVVIHVYLSAAEEYIGRKGKTTVRGPPPPVLQQCELVCRHRDVEKKTYEVNYLYNNIAIAIPMLNPATWQSLPLSPRAVYDT